MTTQAFPAGQAPCVMLAEWIGQLNVEPWQGDTIAIDSAAQLEAAVDGETIIVRGGRGDLRVRVPAHTTLRVANLRGDVTARGVRACVLDDIEGQAVVAATGDVRLRDIYGKTIVEQVESLTIERDEQPRRRQVERRARRDIEVARAHTVDIAEAPDALLIVEAQFVSAGTVGGSCTAREIGERLELGAIGGSCEVARVAGELRLGDIGGNADMRSIGALTQLGAVGGSLYLDAVPLALAGDAKLRITVGGNAQIDLPEAADLTIHATTGGLIRGQGIDFTRAGGMATLRYGNGAARLDLIVGGSLDLHGGTPDIRTAPGGWPRPGSPPTRNAQRSADKARAAILRMVAEGQLTPEEAERRLSELD
jgi:hypothetical protein